MIKRSFRVGLTLGLLAGLVFALVKMFGGRSEPQVVTTRPSNEPWPPLKADPAVPVAPQVSLVPDPAAPSPVAPVVEEAVIAPAPPAPVLAEPSPTKPAAAKPPAAKKKPLVAKWVEPKGDVCPTSHPVKAKLSSKIFHLPGMLNYERTKPDRCYKDGPAAEADGLRPAKR